MTGDLEETLRELGSGYREVADRLVAAFRPADARLAASGESGASVWARCARRGGAGGQSASRRGHATGWSVAYLVAASLLVFVGLGVVFRGERPPAAAGRVFTVRASAPVNEYALAAVRSDDAVRQIVRTQNPDGSWQNDFLTRQNAAALMGVADEEAKVAFKKAMRNLRVRGVAL